MFDAPGVAAAAEASSARVGPLALARCVSALGLDRALADLAARPDGLGAATLGAALFGFTVWDNRPSPSTTALVVAVVAARDAEPGMRGALAEQARTELGRLDELNPCPTWTDPAVLDPD